LGADGIFQIEVENLKTNKLFRKSILFQAKKGSYKQNSDLREQLKKIEKFEQDSSAIFVYTENGYKAIQGTNYLSNKYIEYDLCKYLSDRFLNCHVGIKDMYYNFTEKKIYKPDKIFEISKTQKFKDYLSIKIKTQ